MLYHYLADLVLAMHALFVLFAVFGGILAFTRVNIAWYHIPAALWATAIEFFGWICPLTPLEVMLRRKGGQEGFQTGFIEHYLVPLLYPEALTRNMQVVLGLLVAVLNIVIYSIVFRKYWRKKKERS